MMNIDEAIKKRINELVETNKTTLTALCLNSNLTTSTIKKICMGASILKVFFDREYFNSVDDVY